MTDPPDVVPFLTAVVVGVLAVVVLTLAVGVAVGLARRRGRPRGSAAGLTDRAGFVLGAQEVLDAEVGGAIAVLDLRLRPSVAEILGHGRAGTAASIAADRLRAAMAELPVPARAARLDGDTFALAVAGVGVAGVDEVFGRVRARLGAVAVVDELPFDVPVVLGVAVDDPGDGPDDAGVDTGSRVAALLARADVALTAARRGRGGIRRYDTGLGEHASRRRTLIRGFPGAVRQGQMGVHYQPLVSLGRGTMVGVEALARWEHPELGPLLPDEFVPLLESSGQIDALTTFVLGEALGAARRWLDRGLRLSVAVNVSAATVTSPVFPDRVAAALEAHGVPPELLTLELTESGVAAERETARPVLGRLHALGCRLAVDDFGTGQSSLAHLRRLPIDQIKIDKSFVLGMETERADTAVVRAVVEMGHTLGMSVVAEGVERPAVRSALVEMGCDVAQGYLVSRPLPEHCLDRWMATLDTAVGPGGEGGPLTLIA